MRHQLNIAFIQKKSFNIDYTRDVSTQHITVWSTVHVPQNMKFLQTLNIETERRSWQPTFFFLSLQINNSTAVAVLLRLVWHGLFYIPRFFQNIWKLNLLKYEAEILATQFQQYSQPYNNLPRTAILTDETYSVLWTNSGYCPKVRHNYVLLHFVDFVWLKKTLREIRVLQILGQFNSLGTDLEPKIERTNFILYFHISVLLSYKTRILKCVSLESWFWSAGSKRFICCVFCVSKDFSTNMYELYRKENNALYSYW